MTAADVVTAPVPVLDPAASPPGEAAPEQSRRQPPGRVGLVVGWVVCTIAGVLVVLYALAPIFQERAQHRLLSSYRAQVHSASLEATGLFGYRLPTQPPATGASVAILEIGRIRLQEVVAEGVGPSQTGNGPGHVPGTAGLGQPGNSAVVGRNAAFGGSFSSLHDLRKGDPIVVTTTEGQSLYVVSQVRAVDLKKGAAPVSATIGIGGSSGSTGPVAPTTLGSSVYVDDLYGPSSDNRLTLVTSNSIVPWNTAKAMVVIATMKTVPFTPEPQQSRSTGQDGMSAESGAAAPLVLALLLFGAVAVGAVVLFRRCPLRSAYLISAPPLVVSTVLLALGVSHALPAWM